MPVTIILPLAIELAGALGFTWLLVWLFRRYNRRVHH
jgi:hypothetical protein